MPQQDGRLPDVLVSADLPSITKRGDKTHGIMRNEQSKHAAQYFQRMTDKVSSVGVLSHAAAGLISTLIVRLLNCDSLRPWDSVLNNMRIT